MRPPLEALSYAYIKTEQYPLALSIHTLAANEKATATLFHSFGQKNLLSTLQQQKRWV